MCFALMCNVQKYTLKQMCSFSIYVMHACVPVRNVFELVLLTDCKGLVPLLATPVARCDGFYGDMLLQPMLQFRESSTTTTQWY